MGIGDLRFYTFNVADAAISTAIVLLIGAAIFPAADSAGARSGRMVDPAYAPGVRVAARARRPGAAGSTASSPTRPGCRAATSRSSSPTAG